DHSGGQLLGRHVAQHTTETAHSGPQGFANDGVPHGRRACHKVHGDAVNVPVCARCAERDAVAGPFRTECAAMHVTAKADYAVRAAVELAAGSQDSASKVDEVAQAQGIPLLLLENILTPLRSSVIV